MLNRKLIVVIVAVLSLFASCSSSKKGQGSKEKREDMPTLSYYTLGAKTTLSMGGMSVNATLRMKRDSCVSLSVQPLAGVEVARVFVTNEALTLVDRINKRYALVDLKSGEEIKGGYEKLLSVRKLQSLLTNQLFLLNEQDGAVTMADFSSSQVEGAWLLQYADPQSRFNQEFTLSSERRVKNGMLSSSQGSFRWRYDLFEALENGYYFPMELDMVLQTSSYSGGYHTPQGSSTEVVLTYKKIDLNRDYGFSNPIPKGYEKVSAQEILSLLNIKR